MPSSERVRLFVALDLPAAARAALVDWRDPVVAGAGGALRAVPPESLHVTLCFLGSLDVAAVEPLGEAVVAAAPSGAGAPPLAFGAGLWLPRRRPRVLTVGLEDPSGALASLQARMAAALADGGWYEPEQRPFLPHVTVARVREGGGRGAAGAQAARARAELPPLAPGSFAGEAVALYRSHLGRGPARYEALVRLPLR